MLKKNKITKKDFKYLGSMMASSSREFKRKKGLHGQLFGSWNICGGAPASQSPRTLSYLKERSHLITSAQNSSV